MKTLTLTLLASLSLLLSAAAPKKYNLVGNSVSWSIAANWLPKGVPGNGDTIVIPATKTLTLTNDLTLSNVYMDVHGALILGGNNLKMTLKDASTINVHTTGLISGTKASQQIVLGNIIFKGNEPVVVGPKLATSTSKSFVPYVEFNVLPVTFLSFHVARTSSGTYLVKWVTADEKAADRYEVERSTNGTMWTRVGTQAALGFSKNSYSYTDNAIAGTVYYRIKQIDTDGTFTYTTVNVQKTAATATPVINVFAQTVQVQFAQAAKGTTMIDVIGLNGAVLASKTATNATGTLVLNAPLAKGLVVVRVSNSQGQPTVKQVLL